ncbi:MAG: DUF3365 domain-containing protein [Gammaproteobacteria bacterium]|nr:DUF3365 domain-containing protein [Gammaproteobacteria bacterium]MCF6229739.1 DUF3365 domain-containing protein [Gammaproteobacteria bacterium]
MKNQILFLLLMGAPMLVSASDPLVKESRAAIKAFAGELKGNLQAAMKSGGPLKAVEVCKNVSPVITAEQSNARGVEIRRTSLKLRNPDNAPDAWERKILESFEARKAGGEDVRKIDHHERMVMEGKQVFRYMKAIPTAQKPCTLCHGKNISPELKVALDKAYPNDQARGFEAGDIRGAFSIIKRL